MPASKGTMIEPVPEHRILSGVPAVIHSEPMRKLMAMVLRVALHTTPVLILGETGSGKEIVARAIHQYSLRCAKPLVDVNCGALPDHLVESELFGYEKGRLAEPTPRSRDFLSWPTRESCFWMRSATWI